MQTEINVNFDFVLIDLSLWLFIYWVHGALTK